MPDVLLHFGQSALAGAGGGFELQSELQDPYLILIFSNFAQHLVFLKIHLEFKNIGRYIYELCLNYHYVTNSVKILCILCLSEVFTPLRYNSLVFFIRVRDSLTLDHIFNTFIKCLAH